MTIKRERFKSFCLTYVVSCTTLTMCILLICVIKTYINMISFWRGPKEVIEYDVQ